MAVRSEKVDETVQEGGGLTDELNQFVILIGGAARSLNKLLVKAAGSGSVEHKLNLQTKYYTTSVSTYCFPSFSQYNAWKSRNMNSDEIFIGALFAIIENGSDQLLNEFYINKLDADDLQIQTKAFVLSKEDDMIPLEHAKCIEWCNLNGFEMVYLENTEEAVKEAFENREKLGEARLEELMHVVDWPIKKIETPRLTGHHRLDAVLSILETMSDSEDEDVIPNEQERDGIYEFLGVAQSSRPSNGSSSGNGRVVEASVDVNVALKGGVISSVSVHGEGEGGRKGKGNKGKNGSKANAASRQRKDETRSSVEAEVTVPVRTSKRNCSIEETARPPIAEMEDDADEDRESSPSRVEEGEDTTNLATLINSVKEIRNLTKANGWEEDGAMRVGGAVGVMDRLCRDLLGEEGLMEEVMKIEKARREGTYVEEEDSD